MFREGSLERGSDVAGLQFAGGCSFCIKNKLKSEIFNDRKVYKQKCFSVITKNLNWEILTKNLIIF